MSIAGFGDDPIASFVWPPFTIICQPTRLPGYQAADLLLAEPYQSAHREAPHDLIRRESTGPVQRPGE